MNTSPKGFALIKTEETFSPLVKGDFGGKQQIGYGHDLLPGETFPSGITEDEGDVLLDHDVLACEAALNSLIPSSCTQGQYDALIDFTYECGTAALKMLLSHGWNDVPNQLPRWIYAHTAKSLVKLDGMVIRRQKEINMWNGIV
jgi:lysozyme